MPVALSEEQIINALKKVKYPGFSRDIVSFGLVKGVYIEGTDVTVRISITTGDEKIPTQLQDLALEALQTVPGISSAEVEIQASKPAQQPPPTAAGLPQNRIEGIRHVIAVGSGKGGVGKSTIAANLAIALRQLGQKVGLCDCDIYGPSISHMFGAIDERPIVTADEQSFLPIQRYGVSLMSMGFLLKEDSPAILRGPMVTRYTQHLLRNVLWGELDYLILDLPPGTGDIQLTIVQTVALTGAVVVTTPQEVALIDARKAVAMFQKTNVPVMGIMENMSYFICPNDQNRYAIFGSGGGEREAERLNVPLLGQVPIEMAVRECGDNGTPAVQAYPESTTAEVFRDAAKRLIATASLPAAS
ncbi:MAG: P-loop NTPase [Candidatus Methylacidiphilales bacterium]|nr:Mrp/NBP35 family ATP-binding protein [Candidatus Methylacidiphilales bacterium]